MSEDKCDNLTAVLQSSEEQLSILRKEKSHADKEGLSKFSNLTLALKKAKQNCAELTDENEEHKCKVWKITKELEDLRWERENNSNNRSRKGSAKFPGTPVCQGGGSSVFSYHHSCSMQTSSGGGCGTPSKAIPEQTQLGMLQIENKKLKQELSCLQTNFQLTSQKSVQTRTEAKYMETNLTELQVQFQRVIEEKEDILYKYQEASSELKVQSEPNEEKRKEMDKLKESAEELQKELKHTQEQNLQFQEKMKTELGKVQNSKDLNKMLECQTVSLKNEKEAMEGEMASLREGFRILQEKFQQSSLVCDDEKQKTSLAIGVLESKASHLTREKGDMFEELAQARKQLDQAHDEIQLLQEYRQKLESGLQKKEREIGSMRAQEKLTLNLPGKIEALQDEIFVLNEEVVAMRSKNESLENTRASLEDCVSNLKRANKKLSCDLSRETRRGEEIAHKINTELEVKEDTVQALESDVQEKTKECRMLNKKLKGVVSDLREVKLSKSSIEEDLSGMNLKVRELEDKELLLVSHLKEARGEEMETNTSSNQNILELELQLDAASYALLERESVISDLKCAHELMEMENSTLLTQVTSLSEMVSTRNLKLESQQLLISQHEVEVLGIVEKISGLEGEHCECSKTISRVMEKNEALKVTLEERLAERCGMDDQVSTLKGEVDRLRTSGTILQDTNTDLQVKLEELTMKNDCLASKYSELKDEAYTLEQDFKSEALSLRTTQAELKYAQKIHENEKAEMEGRVESLLSKLEDSDHQCDNLQQRNMELNLRISDMHKRAEELNDTCFSLLNERDGVGEQYRLLRETALSVLQSGSMDVTTPNEDIENQSPGGSDDKGKEEPIDKPGTRKVLQNITSN